MSTSTPRERDLVSRVKLQWQRDGRPDAVTFLSENLGIRQNRSLALELAYEEYCIRRDKGEPVEAQVFCRRFPSISRSLFRQIEVEEYVRSNPAFLHSQATVVWPRIGDELFEFVVVEEIGRGAFARAYLCAQSGVGNRQVVVKVSHGGAIEADTMGGLNHPNIMSVYSVQVDRQSHLTGICMPFVGRSTLYDVIDIAFGGERIPTRASAILEASRAMMRRGDRYQRLNAVMPIDPDEDYTTGVLRLGVQIADALAHAHLHDVLHGDLKPSNIVMSVGGTPMIVDFNLSQSRDSTNLVTGGTLPYMAPEQIRAMLLGMDHDDRVDQRSDIFSLGAILYEMLTGKAASGEMPQDVEPILMAGRMLDKHQSGIEPLQSINPRIPHGLADLIMRCLAYEPAQRPETMQEVRHVLHRHLVAEQKWRRYVRRHPRRILGAIACAAAMAVGTGVWILQRPPLRDRAMAAALVQYEAGDNMAAIELLNTVISADPQHGLAYLARGCAQLREYEAENYRGWLDSAFADISLANRYAPGLEALTVRAYCLLKRGQLELAANEYRNLIKSGYRGHDHLTNLAYCLLQSSLFDGTDVRELNGRFDEVESLLNSAIAVAPDCWQAHLSLAILELQRHGYSGQEYLPERGLDSIREVVRLHPDDAATFFIAMRLAAVVGIKSGNELIISECVSYANRAVDLGHQFNALLIGGGHPFSPLLERDDFQRVLARQPRKVVVSAADRTIPPDCMRLPMIASDINGSR